MRAGSIVDSVGLRNQPEQSLCVWWLLAIAREGPSTFGARKSNLFVEGTIRRTRRSVVPRAVHFGWKRNAERENGTGAIRQAMPPPNAGFRRLHGRRYILRH